LLSVVRPEIQALRAIAVATVVVFHYWPELITGGYVGVDVFFAISGFLITAHLVREVDRTAKVSLPGFWARRARRILPAALLVLLFCAVATYFWVPLNLWEQFFGEIRASTLYVENWNLAAQAVDYLGAENRPSPVQHYWSLSVEEQFYIVWPVLILIAMTLARRGSELLRRRAIAAMLVLLTLASFIYSVIATANDPAAAFFITPTRVWEFGAGGILALAATTTARPASRAAVSWLGVGAILLASFAFTAETPFPGAAALLPILGTVAVIWAGAPALRWAPLGWMRLRPVQWVGDNSYSIYLWHWPLLILAPFVLLDQLTTPIKLGLLALTLILAALTKRFVEDPLRSGPLLAGKRPRRTFIVAAAASAVVLLASFAAIAELNDRQEQDRRATARLLASGERCLGAAARDPDNQPCINPKLRLSVAPSPATARELVTPHDGTEANRSPLCQGGLKIIGLLELCSFGAPANRAERQVVSIGDSHARRWRPGLNIVALESNWRVTSIVRRGCPLNNYLTGSSTEIRSCRQWQRQLAAWLKANPTIDTLVIAQSTGTGRNPERFEARVRGYEERLRLLPSTIEEVIVLRDNPRVSGNTLDCVEQAVEAGKAAGPACAIPRSVALKPDPLAVAAENLDQSNINVIDLTEFYCGPEVCLPVVGGVLIHSDRHHQTELWNRTLAPFVLRELDRKKLLLR
jgi:peptidoglycan/LPS O-acetylase OafA/YrhL